MLHVWVLHVWVLHTQLMHVARIYLVSPSATSTLRAATSPCRRLPHRLLRLPTACYAHGVDVSVAPTGNVPRHLGLCLFTFACIPAREDNLHRGRAALRAQQNLWTFALTICDGPGCTQPASFSPAAVPTKKKRRVSAHGACTALGRRPWTSLKQPRSISGPLIGSSCGCWVWHPRRHGVPPGTAACMMMAHQPQHRHWAC